MHYYWTWPVAVYEWPPQQPQSILQTSGIIYICVVLPLDISKIEKLQKHRPSHRRRLKFTSMYGCGLKQVAAFEWRRWALLFKRSRETVSRSDESLRILTACLAEENQFHLCHLKGSLQFYVTLSGIWVFVFVILRVKNLIMDTFCILKIVFHFLGIWGLPSFRCCGMSPLLR